jgi:hypothetical protein
MFMDEMSPNRKKELEKTGFPNYTISYKSSRLGYSNQLKLPSDSHVFLETLKRVVPESGVMKVVQLDVNLVGNIRAPDLSLYSSSVRRVLFIGHIVRVTTAFQMITQLKECRAVEFRLGNKFQLEMYSNEDLKKQGDSDDH